MPGLDLPWPANTGRTQRWLAKACDTMALVVTKTFRVCVCYLSMFFELFRVEQSDRKQKRKVPETLKRALRSVPTFGFPPGSISYPRENQTLGTDRNTCFSFSEPYFCSPKENLRIRT